MKKLLSLVLVLVICSFVACKKSEDKASTPGKQQAGNKQAANQKRQKKGKAGAPQALQIYQEDKLVVAIPREEYAKLMTTTIKVDGKDQKAILLSDLLKQHNVTGKNVILKGPNRTGSLTWEQATKNPIYIYPVKNRLQVFHEVTELQDVRVPVVLIRIDVAEKPVVTAAKKAAKK